MKIQEIQIWEQLPDTPASTVQEKNIFVEVVLRNGITGIGSAVPFTAVTEESFDTCSKALYTEAPELIKGRDIRQLPKLSQEIMERFPKTPAARAALDMALYDAFSKYLEVPLAYFLGQRIKSLPTSCTIAQQGIGDALKEAEEYFLKGFRIFKIKLSGLIHQDIEHLSKLREEFGRKVSLQVDLNQTYTYDQLLSFHQKTNHLNITLIEQPISSFLPIEMKRLPLYLKNKVVADESLIGVKDALSLINGQKACNFFNIKLMKCGGINEALKIASIALNSGINLVWGCYRESPISTAAALHTALSCPNTKYLDLGEGISQQFKNIQGGFKVEQGYLSISSNPGLGIIKQG